MTNASSLCNYIGDQSAVCTDTKVATLTPRAVEELWPNLSHDASCPEIFLGNWPILSARLPESISSLTALLIVLCALW